MKIEFAKTKSKLDRISTIIAKEAYSHHSNEWQGADVVLTAKKVEPKTDSFYPEPRYVITPYAKELSWLFQQLKHAFMEYLDGCNKIEFYGRLANMALRYQRFLEGAPEQEIDLLQAVLHEAYSILEEMEDGEFKCLSIAVGNTIYDDVLKEVKSEGFLGINETQRFLNDLIKRSQDA
ncbi:MAG: hypothetical protein RBT05_10360 [Bacteroidales bacterium]|jgi:hypothetical protein|nr:hypothetical protein [Bacteroidales bacterium]